MVQGQAEVLFGTMGELDTGFSLNGYTPLLQESSARLENLLADQQFLAFIERKVLPHVEGHFGYLRGRLALNKATCSPDQLLFLMYFSYIEARTKNIVLLQDGEEQNIEALFYAFLERLVESYENMSEFSHRIVSVLRVIGLLRGVEFSEEDLRHVSQVYKDMSEGFAGKTRKTLLYNGRPVPGIEHLKNAFRGVSFYGKTIFVEKLVASLIHDALEDLRVSGVSRGDIKGKYLYFKDKYGAKATYMAYIMTKVDKENYILNDQHFSEEEQRLYVQGVDGKLPEEGAEFKRYKHISKIGRYIRNMGYLNKLKGLFERYQHGDEFLYFHVDDPYLFVSYDEYCAGMLATPDKYEFIEIRDVLECKLVDQLDNLIDMDANSLENSVRKIWEISTYYLPIAQEINGAIYVRMKRLIDEWMQYKFKTKAIKEGVYLTSSGIDIYKYVSRDYLTLFQNNSSESYALAS